jgi:aryl-alcohol dehydrogenase-like predicted oxidoreductase
MRYRTLGDSGLEVSEISLGSWLTYSGGVERDQTDACTRAAFDAGITFFDTANAYGTGVAEEAWGEILADHARLALAWVLRRAEVASAIVGASRPEQVEQNAAASGVELPADVLAAIDEALGDHPVTGTTLAVGASDVVMHR